MINCFAAVKLTSDFPFRVAAESAMSSPPSLDHQLVNGYNSSHGDKMTLLKVTLLGFCSIGLWAQSTSQIQGVVKDDTGAAVPGAGIKATQTETNAIRTTNSGPDGAYVLSNLAIGPYRIEVSKMGFTTYVQTGVVLQVATSPTVDVSLKVGNVTDQVQVEANAALVETQSTNAGAVIENQRILDCPLNGRNPAELVQLVGAAVPAGINGTAGFPEAPNISIGGGLLSGVNICWTARSLQQPVRYPLTFPFRSPTRSRNSRWKRTPCRLIKEPTRPVPSAPS